jgi:dephospho-CoA kinase
MMVIGLTGSIGMGKTTVARQFAALDAHVCSADAIVHGLMARGGKAVAAIGAAFPGVVKDNAVDRRALGAIVFQDKEKLKRLEHILHPLVAEEELRFINAEAAKGARLAVLEIPLLFETGADERCHATVVVTAPFFLQKQRVMKRPHMTEEKFASIIASQMPDRDKRRLADLVVQTGLGRRHSFQTIAAWLKQEGLHEA